MKPRKPLVAAWLGLCLLVIGIPAPARGETVVLLHGLAKTPLSMLRIAHELEVAGYRTCNIGYPTRRLGIEVVARDYVLPRVRECVGDDGAPVSFVTHSMGGIVVRTLHRVDPSLRIHRVVMFGPPNHGSEIVDAWRGSAWFGHIAGPAAAQLGTAPDAFTNRLGPADFEAGVIAGTRGRLDPLHRWLPEPGDGKVTVASTRLDGMRDFIALPVSHASMTWNREAIGQAIGFLQQGHFPR